MERELQEELVFDTAHTNRIAALLNDDSNEVAGAISASST